MKKTFAIAFATILFGTLILSSCSKTDDPAATPTTTSTDPRARFVATWFISEHSSVTGNGTYYDTIVDSSNTSYILHKFLYGFHTGVKATYNGNNFTIPSQIIQGTTVSGSGVLVNANRINMNYLVWSGGSNYDTLTAVLTK
jgi:hypothetical protein